MHRESALALLCFSLTLPTGAEPYKPVWDSLCDHPDPEWFRDAKFGIYFHWGVYSVPAHKTEWYPHHMYNEKHPIHKHHVAKYGHPGKFGYKDFIKDLPAEAPGKHAFVFKISS